MEEFSESGVNKSGVLDAYVYFERRGLVMEKNLTDIVSLSQFNSASHSARSGFTRTASIFLTMSKMDL